MIEEYVWKTGDAASDGRISLGMWNRNNNDTQLRGEEGFLWTNPVTTETRIVVFWVKGIITLVTVARLGKSQKAARVELKS